MSASSDSKNPFLSSWGHIPYEVPPFAEIKVPHYEPAFNVAFEENKREIQAIVDCSDAPTFENTVQRFDRSGDLLGKVSRVFDNLCSSQCPEELQDVQSKMAGPLSNHSTAIYMWPGLFEKVDAVYQARSSLGDEEKRLVERIHLDFLRSGAKFDAAAKGKYASIMEKLAELTTKFVQNVMADESKFTIPLEKEEDFAGLSKDLIEATKQAAEERKDSKAGDQATAAAAVVTLSRSLVEPFLTFSDNRALREKAWRAWTSRGELFPERDNRKLIVEILSLREQQAKMHGYSTYAAFATDDTMAKTPQAVSDLLLRVWEPAKVSVQKERDALMAYISDPTLAPTGDNAIPKLEPWDWRYVAEKVRAARYNLDDAEIKPYFTLEKMIEAMFDCANKLFGLKFKLRPDIPSYHPDVCTYEVTEAGPDGSDKLIAIFLHDNYARPNKQGGAWMSEYRSQSRNASEAGEHVIPIIVNNNNFAKGSPTLLTFDDARTLFHEFGHGMHGMLSNVKYQRLAGTSVLRDFVELPSQLYEHWMGEPSVLKKHARHYITDEPIPDALLDRMMAARLFNQGFATIEYTASALIDQALHQHTPENDWASFDITKFENENLVKLGMPQEIVMRHRPAHFQHLFASSGYAAGM